jgi:hypothetical protein
MASYRLSIKGIRKAYEDQRRKKALKGNPPSLEVLVRNVRINQCDITGLYYPTEVTEKYVFKSISKKSKKE